MDIPAAEPDPARVNEFLVFAAYGQLMLDFQVYELTLWGFRAHRIKRGTSFDQAMEKITGWDRETLGVLWGNLRTQPHWPEGLVEEGDRALSTRNYLAHNFLREYCLIKPSDEIRDRAVSELAAASVRLDALNAAMEAHARTLGVSDADDLDEQTRHELEAMRPTTWLTDPEDGH